MGDKIFAQQAAALREAGRSIVVPPGPAPTKIKSSARPIPTSAPGPKLYDDGIFFPRGDVGSQQFGRRTKANGEVWLNAPRAHLVIELATSDKNGLRAFKTMGGEHIIYQRNEKVPTFAELS